MSLVKIAIVGCHGVGKSRICEKVIDKTRCLNCKNNLTNCKEYKFFKTNSCGANFIFIPEQFREVVKDLNYSNSSELKQTEEITLATYAKQLYLENLYTAQGKNILCDRSVLDTFVYYDYFNRNVIKPQCINFETARTLAINFTMSTYSKIYLIEPSDRPIEPDGFRMTDKKQQLQIYKLFLEYFKGFDNVEIINQEDAHKPEFIEKVVKGFSL